MAIAYLVMSSFPFWAIPLGLILLEQANRSRVRHERGRMLFALITALIFFTGSGLFFYFGGHKNVSPAFRAYREGKLEFYK